AKRRTT
ncbi:bacteriophage lambda tail assembly I family protein, partial [Escherichia coli 96.0428]